MTGDMAHPRPLCAGYLRRLDEADEQEEQQLIAAFADREGFTLTLVFIEKRPGYVVALYAVTRYCQNHDIQDVVVPTSEHLNHLPSLAYLAKNLLQEDIGGRVWIAECDEEDNPSCPLTTKNGGTT